MNFKIEIESVIDNAKVSMEINAIIAFAKASFSKNLEKLDEIMKTYKFEKLIHGRSGSHIWVSYPNGCRILLITEN